MKSHDMVVLFKIESLHQRCQGDVALNKELFASPSSGKNWIGEPEDRAFNAAPELSEKLFSMRALESETGISKTQINISLKRMYRVGLLADSRTTGVPTVNKKSLLEFIAYGIRYVFPAELGKPTRGIPTSVAAPVLHHQLLAATDINPVWPHYLGTVTGYSVEPLHEQVAQAIKNDSICYALLALTDSIRLGQPRERNVALTMIRDIVGE